MRDAVLVNFGAVWSGPCRSMESVTKNLMDSCKAITEILKIDIDTHRELATEYMVQSIPTLILFKNGKEIKRFIGLQDRSNLENKLNKLSMPTD